MSDTLSRLGPVPGSKHRPRRLGRGVGSSLGKMCGRGFKGQKARNPGNLGKPHFQGGQTPIQRRVPKRGFNVPFPVTTVGVNVASLENFDAGASVGEAELRDTRLVQGRDVRIKILGDGDLTKKLTVTAHGFSESAKEKIEKAGGTVVVIAQPKRGEASPDA